MDSEIGAIVDLAQTFGTWAIFLWLFVNERSAHEATRKEYREDLRDVAGLRASLVKAEKE